MGVTSHLRVCQIYKSRTPSDWMVKRSCRCMFYEWEESRKSMRKISLWRLWCYESTGIRCSAKTVLFKHHPPKTSKHLKPIYKTVIILSKNAFQPRLDGLCCPIPHSYHGNSCSKGVASSTGLREPGRRSRWNHLCWR